MAKDLNHNQQSLGWKMIKKYVFFTSHPSVFLTDITVPLSGLSASLALCLPHLSCSIFILSPAELTSGSYWQSEQPFSHKSLTGLDSVLVCCVYVCVPNEKRGRRKCESPLNKTMFHQTAHTFSHFSRRQQCQLQRICLDIKKRTPKFWQCWTRAVRTHVHYSNLPQKEV